MRTTLENRLRELEDEYQKGQERLDALNREKNELNHTMLRISGAIQVINELLETEPSTHKKPLTNGVGTLKDQAQSKKGTI